MMEKMKKKNTASTSPPGGPGPVFRPWGSYEVLAAGEGYQVKRIIVKPRQRLSLQYHNHRSEHWVVVIGPATVTIDDREEVFTTGQYVYIPRTARHRLANATDEPITVIEVQQGDYLGEDDIVRLADDYQRS